MAIRKCPYCKAIIEEGAEFCSNCGTQLLFPEDEKIDEEIPGEKIVDDDADDDDEEAEIELPEEEPPLLQDEEVETAEPVEKKTNESVELQDVELNQEPGDERQEKKDDQDDFNLEEQAPLNEELEKEIDAEEEILVDEIVEIKLDDRDEEEIIKKIKKETVPDSNEEILKIEDLDKTLESSEIEKQDIDRFIDSMRQDQGEDVPSVPLRKDPVKDFLRKDEEPEKEDVPDFIPPPEESQDVKEPFQKDPVLEAPVEEEPVEEEPDEEIGIEVSPPLSSTPPSFEKQVIVPPTDELPAWASKIKEEPPSNIPITEAEKKFVPQERTPTMDTGMGFPEAVAQKDLPFSGETFKEKEKKPKESSSQISTWIKPRVFDVLFIGAVWFITTWIASYVMEVKLFKLISAAGFLLLIFYVVLLSAYLFLFFFFLGETLGDYLFKQFRESGSDPLT